jgi:tetratricopeptide (TPR) repeat protein
LQGRELHNRRTASWELEAVQEYEQAIEMAPGFAEAYGALAMVYFSLALDGGPKAYFKQAKANADKALDLDPTLVEAKIVEGLLEYFFYWNWENAQAALDEALRLDSSLVESHPCYLHCMDALGRTDQSLAAVRSALMRQPDSMALRRELGCVYYYAHEFENSLDAYHAVLKDDTDNPQIYFGLGRAYGQLRRYDEAIDALETGRKVDGGNWSGLLSELGYVYARSGQSDKAKRILDELQRRENEEHEFVDPYVYAMIYVGLDENAKAFQELQRAYEIKSPWLPSLNTEPKFAHLHEDPRFQSLARTLRFRARAKARALNNSGKN